MKRLLKFIALVLLPAACLVALVMADCLVIAAGYSVMILWLQRDYFLGNK